MAGLETHGSPSEEEFIVPWLGCTWDNWRIGHYRGPTSELGWAGLYRIKDVARAASLGDE
jgi:hypothetical protein